MRVKHVLLATGVAAAVMSLFVVPAVWNFAGNRSPFRSSSFFAVDGALLVAAVGAFSASWSIDPHPMARRERFALARDYNAARLPDDDEPDDPAP
jgi:hypothetical protein